MILSLLQRLSYPSAVSTSKIKVEKTQTKIRSHRCVPASFQWNNGTNLDSKTNYTVLILETGEQSNSSPLRD